MMSQTRITEAKFLDTSAQLTELVAINRALK